MVKIVKTIKKIKSEPVYDISVNEHNHYILDNGIISHNSGLRYSASSIVMLTKSKDRDGTDVVGNFIKVKMDKSRLSKENVVVQLKLSYQSGLDPYYGLLALAEKYGIIKKSGTRYELPDGTKVFGKEINKHPEKYFNKELMLELEEAANKEFKYGGNLGEDGPGKGSEDTESDSDE